MEIPVANKEVARFGSDCFKSYIVHHSFGLQSRFCFNAKHLIGSHDNEILTLETYVRVFRV